MVLKGSVDVVRAGRDGPIHIADLREDSFFGEISFLGRRSTSASVIGSHYLIASSLFFLSLNLPLALMLVFTLTLMLSLTLFTIICFPPFTLLLLPSCN